jgi:hypothetical protein
MLKSLVAVSAGLIGGAHAFWRMECPGRVGLARLDPIIDPGKISMHAHSIHGSSGKRLIRDDEILAMKVARALRRQPRTMRSQRKELTMRRVL